MNKTVSAVNPVDLDSLVSCATQYIRLFPQYVESQVRDGSIECPSAFPEVFYQQLHFLRHALYVLDHSANRYPERLDVQDMFADVQKPSASKNVPSWPDLYDFLLKRQLVDLSKADRLHPNDWLCFRRSWSVRSLTPYTLSVTLRIPLTPRGVLYCSRGTPVFREEVCRPLTNNPDAWAVVDRRISAAFLEISAPPLYGSEFFWMSPEGIFYEDEFVRPEFDLPYITWVGEFFRDLLDEHLQTLEGIGVQRPLSICFSDLASCC